MHDRQISVSTSTYSTDEDKWQAVLGRDRQADGQFVTAVRSTRIYCRPSCPARHPGRLQVSFYADPDQARAAGYRACKRCNPDAITDERIMLVQAVCRYIEANLDQPLTLAVLGAQFHTAPDHLAYCFKQVMGITPRAYRQTYQLDQLRHDLRAGEPIAAALYEVGYQSTRSVYDQTPLGMTPGVYRKGGANMNIEYAIVPSPLGLLLVATTEKGVCFLALGESADALENDLMREFPHAAALHRADDHLSATVDVVLNYLAGHAPDLRLPLDVQATAFQRQVWDLLRTIPYGETSTYQAIAQALGNPKASRAVGRACATNPVSLIIPCHRVLRSDGDLNGYRWGLDRKRALIDLEARTVSQPSPELVLAD